MGGKRPDQHQISPGEAGSTDYKWVRRAEDGLIEHVPDVPQKSRRASRASGRGLIPPAVANPEVERVRADHEGEAEGEEFVVEFTPEEEDER